MIKIILNFRRIFHLPLWVVRVTQLLAPQDAKPPILVIVEDV